MYVRSRITSLLFSLVPAKLKNRQYSTAIEMPNANTCVAVVDQLHLVWWVTKHACMTTQQEERRSKYMRPCERAPVETKHEKYAQERSCRKASNNYRTDEDFVDITCKVDVSSA